MTRFETRLARLEEQHAPSWKAFLGRPLVEWPNDALDVLCDDDGTLELDTLTDAETDLLSMTFEGVDCEAAE